MNEKKQPSLQDLGLDAPIQPSKKISISELQRQSEFEREQPQQPRVVIQPKKKSWVMPAFFCVIGLALLVRFIVGGDNKPAGQGMAGPALPAGGGAAVGEKAPTYKDAIQALVDDVDQKLGANIFGTVSTSGRSAKIIIESEYFTRLEPDAQRLALETVAKAWKEQCYGKEIKFTTWNGKLVAEF